MGRKTGRRASANAQQSTALRRAFSSSQNLWQPNFQLCRGRKLRLMPRDRLGTRLVSSRFDDERNFQLNYERGDRGDFWSARIRCTQASSNSNHLCTFQFKNEFRTMSASHAARVPVPVFSFPLSNIHAHRTNHSTSSLQYMPSSVSSAHTARRPTKVGKRVFRY